VETKNDHRRDAILDEAVRVFGRFGYQKTSVQDIAAAAGLSKPGLYLHFSGKDEIFSAAIEKYLSDALDEVRRLLAQDAVTLGDRLLAAMEAWFGRHLSTFTPQSFDVIEAGDRLSADKVEGVKRSLRQAIANALIVNGFTESAASDRAQVLFLCGLSWKQPGTTPEKFRSVMDTCVRVCCGAKPLEIEEKTE
jgi:AcrR family transcriptional regulator